MPSTPKRTKVSLLSVERRRNYPVTPGSSGRRRRGALPRASQSQQPAAQFFVQEGLPVINLGRTNFDIKMPVRRKTRTKKKNIRTYQSRSAADTTLARRYLAVYNDPFSQASNTPRIPDGKEMYSIGLRHRQRHELTYQQDGEIECFLFPGLNHGMIIRGGKSGGYPTSTSTNTTLWYSSIPDYARADVALTGSVGTSSFGVALNQTASNEIAKWRIVSQGLHIRLVNNSEENDGWYEAVRYSASHDAKEYFLKTERNTIGTDESTFSVLPRFPLLPSSTLLNLPSYHMAKLRDIDKVKFCLHPEGGEHNFVDVRDEYSLSGSAIDETTPQATIDMDDGATGSTPLTPRSLEDTGSTKYTLNFLNDLMTAHDIVQASIDHGYDCIYIKIHGRAGDQNRNPSRLVFDLVQNHEIVYDERAINNRFHQKAVKSTAAVNKAQANLKKKTEPGTKTATK